MRLFILFTALTLLPIHADEGPASRGTSTTLLALVDPLCKAGDHVNIEQGVTEPPEFQVLSPFNAKTENYIDWLSAVLRANYRVGAAVFTKAS